LNTLTAEHRLYQIKGCTEGGTTLKGIQLTAAIVGDTIISKVKLEPFGNIKGTCKTDTLAAGEYIKELTFYYTNSMVTGVSYTTSTGQQQTLGKISTKKFSFAFSTAYNFMGFFGSSSTDQIDSLGAIRMKTDCQNFSKPADQNSSTADNSTSTSNATSTSN
jgi:hypothetical protein